MAVAPLMSVAAYFETRLPQDSRRTVLWQTLYEEYFKQFIPPTATVLDLGCGYGDFINAVVAKRRISIDLWEGAKRHVDTEVEHHIGPITDLSFLQDASVDVAFASNVFEHLTRAELLEVLDQLKRKLTGTGQLLIVQPNYRFAFREYFDDYTHVSVYSHVSMCDLLLAHGYDIEDCVPRFLPLTIKSRLGVWPWLIKLYLRSPFKIMGKQMMIRARRGQAR
jgi:SAM-dependent methyltransferase